MGLLSRLAPALVIAAVFSGSVDSAFAANMTFSGTTLTGANGVVVNSVSYDVSFLDGSFNSVFGANPSQFLWANLGDSGLAVAALKDQVFSSATAALQPAAIRGCASYSCQVVTWSHDTGSQLYDLVGPTATSISAVPAHYATDNDFTLHQDRTLAVWSVHVSPVPEPQSYAMLLAGLGVLAAVARRRRAVPASAPHTPH